MDLDSDGGLEEANALYWFELRYFKGTVPPVKYPENSRTKDNL